MDIFEKNIIEYFKHCRNLKTRKRNAKKIFLVAFKSMPDEYQRSIIEGREFQKFICQKYLKEKEKEFYFFHWGTKTSIKSVLISDYLVQFGINKNIIAYNFKSYIQLREAYLNHVRERYDFIENSK